MQLPAVRDSILQAADMAAAALVLGHFALPLGLGADNARGLALFAQRNVTILSLRVAAMGYVFNLTARGLKGSANLLAEPSACQKAAPPSA